MRYLFVIQGEGCGHPTQALSFRPEAPDKSRRICVVPPLLRREALAGTSSNTGFILGYMVNNGFAHDLRHWCGEHPQCPVHVFCDHPLSPETWHAEGRLVLYRLDDRLFLEMMRNCRGYVATAGFESVCEAMYHGKPMMLIPAHIEQRINAADAAASGTGITSDRFDLDRFNEFLARHPQPDPGFRRWVDSAEGRILQLLTC